MADTGPGIPEEHQAPIFEQFHQVDSSNTKAKGGTGLGLAIAKQIMEMHGGRIWVGSTLGKGSTFQMELRNRREHVQHLSLPPNFASGIQFNSPQALADLHRMKLDSSRALNALQIAVVQTDGLPPQNLEALVNPARVADSRGKYPPSECSAPQARSRDRPAECAPRREAQAGTPSPTRAALTRPQYSNRWQSPGHLQEPNSVVAPS